MKKIILLLILFTASLVNAQFITIKHAAYEIKFDTVLKEPLYTHYILTQENATHLSKDKRLGFKQDKLISQNLQGNDNDYNKYSKYYDRGHLSPYKDFTWNLDTENDSMLYTNCAPQILKFNRGTWKQLEDYVRHIALNGDIQVYTGCIYENATKKIGKLIVPLYYWKLIQNKDGYQAWKIPNAKPKNKDNFQNYKIDYQDLLKLIQ